MEDIVFSEGAKPIIDALPDKWKTHALVWIPAILYIWGFIVKPFNARFQAVMTERISNSVNNKEDADRYHAILSSNTYWYLSLFLDMVFRIKLPTHSDFHKLVLDRFPPADTDSAYPTKPAGTGDT